MSESVSVRISARAHEVARMIAKEVRPKATIQSVIEYAVERYGDEIEKKGGGE